MKLLALVLGTVAIAVTLTLAMSRSDATRVHAQTPTPTPITDLGANWDSASGLIGPTPVIRWRTVQGIDHFQLTATLQAVRVNRADPFCTAPIESGKTTISIDQTLPGAATDLAVAFPPLTESDMWFVYSSDVVLRAFAPGGSQIGAQGGGGVAEALCPRPAPTQTTPSSVHLPNTGAAEGTRGMPMRAVITLLLSGLAIASLGGFLRQRRMGR